MANRDLMNCPACGADLAQHMPETDDTWETWRFFCRGEIVRQDGQFVENDPCRDALSNAIADLNAKRIKAVV